MYVESRRDIIQKFEVGTMRKGAIVLRRFKEALTEKKLLKGVKYYLADNQLKSVSPEDLFAALQKAFNEDFPGNSLDIDSMMTPWLELRGYPVVTVSRSEHGLTFKQETF